MTGELCIGGAGVGAGYLGDPQLTASKFVANPFTSTKGERLYRTGDLCRYREDGAIDFVGRMDDLVKIRGNRVELGEIESILRTHSQIKDCAVIAVDDLRGNKRLVSFIVQDDANSDPNGNESNDALTSPDEMRRFLGDKLPPYMVPSIFNSLEQMPLTSHGKVDRQALASMGSPTKRNDYVAPRNECETTLTQLWHCLLYTSPSPRDQRGSRMPSSA